jgi:phosphoglycolate phosphatase
MRCLYIDLDGTLLGRNASLMHDGAGNVSLLGVRAIEACLRADIEIVVVSGRRKAQVMEGARLLGQGSYIYESGSAVVLDGEELWLTGDVVPDERGTIHAQIAATGAPDLLLERFRGRLEVHDPWHVNREVSHIFRGEIEAAEADALLVEHGHHGLRLVDNGVIAPVRRTLDPAIAQIRAYHLVPRGASKANAVARHMRARAYAPDEVIAVGDSREDVGMADHVGTFWLVANALEKDPGVGELVAGRPNVRLTEEGHGAGVYEAVVTTLAERRSG